MYYLGLVHGLTQLKLVSGHHLHLTDWLTRTPHKTHNTLTLAKLCTYALHANTQRTHTHTQPNWKLHELISVPPPPHSRSRTLTSVLEKSADTLHTCPPRSIQTPLLCLVASCYRDNSLVSCPVLLCHWPTPTPHPTAAAALLPCETTGSAAVSGGWGCKLHITRGHWLTSGWAVPSLTKAHSWSKKGDLSVWHNALKT